MNREEENSEEVSREQRLRLEINLIAAVTAEFEAAAGDLLAGTLSPSNARARQEVIELLGVNYVGPESLGRLLFGDENKFPQVDLDFVKLKEILNEPDEFDPRMLRRETYALVFRPPISFLELRDRANDAAESGGKRPAFCDQEGYETEAFATDLPAAGSWELIRRGTVPGSTSKTFEEQKELIADKQNLTPASFSALVSLLVGQYLSHDIRLYYGQEHYGRTSTCSDSGDHLYVGDLNFGGAYVFDDISVTGDELAGLAISLNLELEFQKLKKDE